MTMVVWPRIPSQSIDITQQLHVRFEFSIWPFSRSDIRLTELRSSESPHTIPCPITRSVPGNALVVTGPNSGSALLDNCQNLLSGLQRTLWLWHGRSGDEQCPDME